MPTGYTAKVATGEISDFESFAWLCARAFGACISLRDDPMTTTRPGVFVARDYHRKALSEARSELARLVALTDDDWCAEHDAAQKKVIYDRESENAKRLEQKGRYETMLNAVIAWEPPTEDHVEMKSFMEKQLRESIDFDCAPVDKYYPDLPPVDQWKLERIESARRNIEYHEKEDAKEHERIRGRNAWIEALAESLVVERDQ